MFSRKYRLLRILLLVIVALSWGVGQGQALVVPGPGSTPDVFGPYPNYANSPIPSLVGSAVTPSTGIRKFVDTLPGLTSAGSSTPLGNYIPVAVADTTAYPGDDYYEIALVAYAQKMHSDLPATELRGYVQLETAANAGVSKHIALKYRDGTPILKNGVQVLAVDNPTYLGPAIVANKDKAVRVKFTNFLHPGAAGNLPIPVDTTLMGAGMGPDGATPYTQNRSAVHLHGGATPWISDGTPHQWTTPVGETALYKRGASVQFVPDMWFDSNGNRVAAGTPGATNDPGPGSLTLYYTNQQSSRLMFYHDHAVGITRLNVYAGIAAPYVLRDPVELALISGGTISGTPVSAGTIPADEIPLVIQDKTFVDSTTIAAQDPTWNWGKTPPVPNAGDLWFPHVYMPNQNPKDPFGLNAMGRWDYNTWMYPPITTQVVGPKANPYFPNGGEENPLMPGIPDVTAVPEAFMDTPIVNGIAYPSLTVAPKPYRFRILNAANDRTLNLSLFYADPVGATLIKGGSGYVSAPTVSFSGGGATTQATATATITNVVSAVTVSNGGAGYLAVPTVSFTGGGLGATAQATLTGGVVTGITVISGGSGYTSVPAVVITGFASTPATATATITGVVNAINVTSPGSGYISAPTITITGGGGSGAVALASPNKELKMVPAVVTPSFPPKWPTDARDGGVPDPATVGPSWLQIGNEGGFLPAPTVIPPQPVTYQYFRRTLTVLNVLDHALALGPAERADVIVDFSSVPAGSTLILYNDGPAPWPGFDTRLDYYTGDVDQSNTGNMTGGAPTTLPGYGPNTRTIMQIKVSGTASPAFNTSALAAAWPVVYRTAQDPPIVPEPEYGPAFGTTFPTNYIVVSNPTLTFVPYGGTTPITLQTNDKAIIENWDMTYGRMNALLGGALPNQGPQAGVALPFSYFNPPTEVVENNKIQLWRINHQGVDTHSIHFHLFNVQVIDKVALDGQLFPPDANELGWKETVRMNPAVDTIIAIKPKGLRLPFALPDSNRPLDPSMPIGAPMLDAAGTTVTNVMTNFGYEYVWHCHLLGHEENDMMRPIVYKATDRIGVFRNGQWYLDRDGDGIYSGTDPSYGGFGTTGDVPVAGDWNGSGASKIGVFRNGTWYLNLNGDGKTVGAVYSFGTTGDIPVVGDWNGDGKAKIGVFRNGTWYLNLNGDGKTVGAVYSFGATGDIPVAGDWNGSGASKIGVFRNGTWYLDTNGNGTVGATYSFGTTGDKPAVGDWRGDGKDKIGVLRNGTWYLDTNGNGTFDATDTYFGNFGTAGDFPVAGKW